ncbi:MAG TPA: hypothetical protein VLB09_06485, partial [Nitrospiria bacterium]|nr:hypothetical protein [Nitrospiria bacterium]
YIDEAGIRSSVHAPLACGDCHAVDSIPHEGPILPGSEAEICVNCHSGVVEEFQTSVHFDSDSMDCLSCHGPPHEILPPNNPKSPVFALNLPGTCAACHDDPGRAEKYNLNSNDVYGTYIDSIHGKAVSRGGLLVAANCSSCHGVHGIKSPGDPKSTAHRLRVSETCGNCHAGILLEYRESIHGERFTAGLFSAPVCTDCHTAHEVRHVREPAWKLEVVRECGDCHAESHRTFRDTFHGKVTSLGFTRVAQCSDCHGAHDIHPSRDPRSRVHEDSRLSTCQACHPKATAGFAQFDPHADPHDRDRNPVLFYVSRFMTLLLAGVFSFFGLHTVAWAVRSSIEKRKNSGPSKKGNSGDYYIRFSLEQRILHGVLIVTFLGIVITGMPILYSQSEWAIWLAHFLGGFGVMGFWHRFFALVLTGLFVFHLGRIAHAVLVRKQWNWLWGPDSLVPQPRDLAVLWANLKWFFGLGPRPRFGRFTYWEKFDYLAVFWGMPVIGMTGYVLWFDEFFGRFIPGWWFNVASVIHGEEALLAAVFIFTIHYFNTHLRPEKFPMDQVIFTGRVSEAELREERPEEFEELVEKRALDALRVSAPERWLERLAWIAGGTAVIIGLTMFFLILFAVFG